MVVGGGGLVGVQTHFSDHPEALVKAADNKFLLKLLKLYLMNMNGTPLSTGPKLLIFFLFNLNTPEKLWMLKTKLLNGYAIL